MSSKGIKRRLGLRVLGLYPIESWIPPGSYVLHERTCDHPLCYPVTQRPRALVWELRVLGSWIRKRCGRLPVAVVCLAWGPLHGEILDNPKWSFDLATVYSAMSCV